NSLVPADSVMTCGISSQTTSSSTMPPTPRMTGSERCHSLFAGAASSSAGAAAMLVSMAVPSFMLLPHAPREGRALGPGDAFGEDDRDHHEHEDAGEHAVEREHVAKLGDGVADAFRCSKELAHQNADERTAHGDARAGDHIGQHARHDHLEVEVLLAAAER